MPDCTKWNYIYNLKYTFFTATIVNKLHGAQSLSGSWQPNILKKARLPWHPHTHCPVRKILAFWKAHNIVTIYEGVWLQTGFGFIGFINQLQVVLQTTITLVLFPHFTVHCYTHLCPQSGSIISFLATDFNTGTTTVSLNYTLQISLYYSTRKFFSSQPDCQLSSERHLLSFPTLD
jgi:hypothetical protein